MPKNEIVQALQEMGLTPIDWVDASKFAELTGIGEDKLPHRKKKWPENIVWTKQDNNIYYSIKGYNKWLTEQARMRCRRASGLETGQSKSTRQENTRNSRSRYPTRRLQKVSRQPLKLEVT